MCQVIDDFEVSWLNFLLELNSTLFLEVVDELHQVPQDVQKVNCLVLC